MIRLRIPFLPFAMLAFVPLIAAAEDAPRKIHTASAGKGMVVSVSPHASLIGRRALERGGTAVDAAVATAFALAVTWPEAGNIGGGGFMLVHPSDGAPPVCIDYRETAPGAATRNMYNRNSSRFDQKAVGTPGTVRGLYLAHQRFGRLPWKSLVRPAADLAEDGFQVDSHLAASLNGVLEKPSVRRQDRYAELRRVYGHPQQRPWRAGDRMVLTDLARTLRRIGEGGADAFYRGPIAEQLVDEMQSGNGLISKQDLAKYEAKVRPSVHGRYRGFDIYGAPPPSSGGTCTILAMQMLESFDLRQARRYSPRTVHLMAEAMRRSFHQRARSLGDPDFVSVPEELVKKDYARRLAGGIQEGKATPSDSLSPEVPLAAEAEDTTHFSIVDAEGMGVANTYTLEGSWGARIVVRGAGFVLNNEMGDFNWLPGLTDRKGRIGTKANLIAPRKRMLSSQSPTIVARDGKVYLVTGSPGGRTIINTVIGILVNVLEYQMDLPAAVTAPRSHHQWFPDQIVLEAEDPAKAQGLIEQLRKRGHDVQTRKRQGSAHSIIVDRESGVIQGVADWRRGGLAAGVSAIAR